MHHTRALSARRQQEAGPECWEATYRRMVLFDLAADIELGFFLAYYRSFAIPSIAATLHRNGEIIQRPLKRSYDTAIVTYEIICNGLDSARGRHMVDLLNRAHRHVPGSRDDFLYVLLTLLVVPLRWAREHAWRAPTAAEEEAAVCFYQELGERMNISGVPATFHAAERFFDSYEHNNLAHSRAGAELMSSAVNVLGDRLPAPVKPWTRPILSAMFDDDRLTNALGLPRTRAGTQWALSTALNLRNMIQRRRPLGMEPRFTPGRAGSSLYPGGYRLEDIGPGNIMPPP